MNNISLCDPVFSLRQRICHDVTIPSCIRKCDETGRLKAYLLQWKKGDADTPHIYWDSDVAKVLEGMAEMLMIRPDPVMAQELDRLVDLVISAQQEDGFLNVHFTVVEPNHRWSYDGGRHELYCAGHLMEAAVAHFYATGSRKFLDAMCRYADYIDSVFGNGRGKKRGYPGHEEIELALVKLYHATGEKRYLNLAKYFIDERGCDPDYYRREDEKHAYMLPNIQAHKPVRRQDKAEGHAVRAVYLYCGMVDVAVETGDRELLNTAIRIFDNIASRRMYITGGIGSTARGEQFTTDFGLPNDTAYAESCAAIGLALFARRLLVATGDSKYAEVMERVLYNNGLSGIALSGDEFFYANLLEVNDTTYEFEHVKKVRQKWFDCSCCPTSYSRFLPQLGKFCYSLSPETAWIHIPAAAKLATEQYEIEVEGSYPCDGNIKIRIHRGGAFTLALRIPSWSRGYTVAVNGSADRSPLQHGYWMQKLEWMQGDTVELKLNMEPVLIYPHPQIVEDAGKAAIQRGPVVYCLESVDNPGILLHQAILPAKPEFRLDKAEGLPPETVAIRCKAKVAESDSGELYRTALPKFRDTEICAIPYALWQNRGNSSMQVFLRAESMENRNERGEN